MPSAPEEDGVVRADGRLRPGEGGLAPCAECSIHETLDALPLGFFRTSLDGKWLSANSTLARLLGYASVAELVASAADVGRDVYARPGERERLRAGLDRDGIVRGHEVELRQKDGALRWCSISARLVRRSGEEAYYEGLVEDFSEVRRARVELVDARAELEQRVRERTAELERTNRALAAEVREREEAERELRDSEERYRALAQNSLDVIMRFDREGRHLYVNASVEASTGIPPAAYLGRTHREMGFPEELVAIWEPAIDSVFHSGKMNRVEFRLPSGVWIDWLLMPEYAADGSVQSVVTSARDITERKRAEDVLRSARDELEARVADRTEELRRASELLRESEKMRALGVLAGGIAHDFNNLLQALLGATALLRRRRRDEEAHERLVGQIEADIGRGVALSRQLLLFARREKARTADVDLNDVLRSCGHLLGRLVRENVALRFELSPEALPARVDAGQIEQVLVNLTLNACDAITGGGSV
ncbi:MAG: PAS domain S-box protein, partial [Vicinamibacteria bacterium]